MNELKRKEKHILRDLCKSKAKFGLSIILKIVIILSITVEIRKNLTSGMKIQETTKTMGTHMSYIQITQDIVIRDYDYSSQNIYFF